MKICIPQSSNDYSSNWKSFKQTQSSKSDSTTADTVTVKSVVKLKPSNGRNRAKNLSKRKKLALAAEKEVLSCYSSVASPSKKLNYVAMDCEYVGCGAEKSDQLARVSIVDCAGNCVYDKFVAPREPVTDFRTFVSGIRPRDLINGGDFSVVQKEVQQLLADKILVGHSIKNDLQVLCLSHPRKLIRDTAVYGPFRALSSSFGTPSLKKLAYSILGITIQHGEHNSIEDAHTALMLYKMHRREWERSLKNSNRFAKKRL